MRVPNLQFQICGFKISKICGCRRHIFKFAGSNLVNARVEDPRFFKSMEDSRIFKFLGKYTNFKVCKMKGFKVCKVCKGCKMWGCRLHMYSLNDSGDTLDRWCEARISALGLQPSASSCTVSPEYKAVRSSSPACRGHSRNRVIFFLVKGAWMQQSMKRGRNQTGKNPLYSKD